MNHNLWRTSTVREAAAMRLVICWQSLTYWLIKSTSPHSSKSTIFKWIRKFYMKNLHFDRKIFWLGKMYGGQYRCPCFWQNYQVSTYFRRSKWKTVKFGIGPTGWTYFSRSSFSKNSKYLANFEAWTWVFLFRCLTWGSRAFPWGRPASPAAIARSEPRCAGRLARCSRATWTQLKWDF